MTIWQLNEDILRFLLTEWLEWKDLSALDVAYLNKKDRTTVWLSSLTHLTIPTRFDSLSLSHERTQSFYQWLTHRRVFCIEGFPVPLDLLNNLLVDKEEDDDLDFIKSSHYYSVLHSIKIVSGKNADSQVGSNLSVFLRQC